MALLVWIGLECLTAALLFESSQVLLNPILLGLSVRAKAIVIQNGNQAQDPAPYGQNEGSSTCCDFQFLILSFLHINGFCQLGCMHGSCSKGFLGLGAVMFAALVCSADPEGFV